MLNVFLSVILMDFCVHMNMLKKYVWEMCIANIHGHIHKTPANNIPSTPGNYYNVNIEFNDYLPVSLEFLKTKFPNK